MLRNASDLKSKVLLAYGLALARRPDAVGRRQLVRIRLEGQAVELALRLGSVDPSVLMQVTHYGEYDAPGVDWENVKTIVDAGANIGISSVLFSIRSPQAKVLAIEPDTSNLELLHLNVQDLNGPLAEILNAAVWIEPGEVHLGSSSSSVAHRVLMDGNGTKTKAVTIRELAAKLGGRIDLLKLDIEGAELDLIQPLYLNEWAPFVDRLLVECHSRFGFGASAPEFCAALEPFGFESVCYNDSLELVFAKRA